MSCHHREEVASGRRFEFGANWSRFLASLSEPQIEIATDALRNKLGDLSGLSFVDVGCGSGLSSLAAMRLGAARVHSFDYDPQSVACTLELKRRYFARAENWTVEEGSVLDDEYLARLGKFNVTYSWGVLHHTGAMWRSLDNVSTMTGLGDRLFVALYNDQGRISDAWRVIKRMYNRLPGPLKPLYTVSVVLPLELRLCVRSLLRGRPRDYLRTWTEYANISGRGMSRWRDIIDWIGGYPFEVASPSDVTEFFGERGFVLDQPLPARNPSLGCNEFVFRRAQAQRVAS